MWLAVEAKSLGAAWGFSLGWAPTCLGESGAVMQDKGPVGLGKWLLLVGKGSVGFPTVFTGCYKTVTFVGQCCCGVLGGENPLGVIVYTTWFRTGCGRGSPFWRVLRLEVFWCKARLCTGFLFRVPLQRQGGWGWRRRSLLLHGEVTHNAALQSDHILKPLVQHKQKRALR